jgi:hypothetical protein
MMTVGVAAMLGVLEFAGRALWDINGTIASQTTT